jgi:hypothetical protein
MQSVRLVGAGSFLPRRVVSNARLASAIPGWSAERITSRTGIEERRFLWDFDAERGQALAPPAGGGMGSPRSNVDMGEVALRRALGSIPPRSTPSTSSPPPRTSSTSATTPSSSTGGSAAAATPTPWWSTRGAAAPSTWSTWRAG